MTGTTCTAFASIGKQLGIRDVTILPFLAWCGLRLLLQEPVLIHENSVRFPGWILRRFLGHLYDIQEVHVDAARYGVPVRHERKYTLLVRRTKAVLSKMVPSLECWGSRFWRECVMSWSELFFAHLYEECRDEVDEDLTWACSRRASCANNPDFADDTSTSRWERALTEFEKRSLAAYRQTWPGEAYSLTQNGATSHAMKSSPTHMQTLIHNMGLLWTDKVGAGIGPLSAFVRHHHDTFTCTLMRYETHVARR